MERAFFTVFKILKYLRWSLAKVAFYLWVAIPHRLAFCSAQLLPVGPFGNQIRGLVFRPLLKRCGRNLQLSSGATIEAPHLVSVGDNVYLGPGVWISGIRGGIELADEVMMGPYVSMVSSNHTKKDSSYRFGPGVAGHIRVGRGVWLGAHVCVMGGVSIGDGALVGAGAVVTRDIDSDSIVGGVPARRLQTPAESDSNQTSPPTQQP